MNITGNSQISPTKYNSNMLSKTLTLDQASMLIYQQAYMFKLATL
jgi:hypothetical protein